MDYVYIAIVFMLVVWMEGSEVGGLFNLAGGKLLSLAPFTPAEGEGIKNEILMTIIIITMEWWKEGENEVS